MQKMGSRKKTFPSWSQEEEERDPCGLLEDVVESLLSLTIRIELRGEAFVMMLELVERALYGCGTSRESPALPT